MTPVKDVDVVNHVGTLEKKPLLVGRAVYSVYKMVYVHYC